MVSYRPGAWLEAALDAAGAQADQVVLVDNGSEHHRAGKIGARVGVDIVRLDRNVGFAAGVNAGVNRAAGDLIALLNDDAIPDRGWIDTSENILDDSAIAAVAPKLLLASTFAEVRFPDGSWKQPPDPRPLGRRLHDVSVAGRDVLDALLGGVHRLEVGTLDGQETRWRWTSGPDAVYVPLEDDGDAARIRINGVVVAAVRTVRLVNNAGSYLSAEGHGGDHGWETPDDGQFDAGRECFAACGAAMAFTRASWERVGRFAEPFFAYYEDVDWCWRARLGGQRIVYEPHATVRHIRSATSGGQVDATVRLWSARNRLHALARNAPLQVVHRQLRRANEGDHPPELHRLATKRVARGMIERVALRRRWQLRPTDVWRKWAGVDEQWRDPGRVSERQGLPPRLEFGG